MARGINGVTMEIDFEGGKRVRIRGEYDPVNNEMDFKFTDRHKRPLQLEPWEAEECRMLFMGLAQMFGSAASGANAPEDKLLDANSLRNQER
ncbi:hypothetical protein I8J29_09915 [Paenibacillus sp. MWE-103]|uniref:Uncharacterized protein n=1 Tax=Paenibacillus artemisiicola TaxID=1172618 RepID=A0ABS3W873_9BACL|nr:hypothetical protein [Paenibacillus artemisiicola]MBO7744512.1 hypothetical protein [Paenibacillus artemisiicola]